MNLTLKNFLKERRVIAGVLTFFSILLVSLWINGIQEKKTLVDLNSTYWENKVKKDGAEKVYLEFKEYYTPREFSEQHTAAHIMGRILYRTNGLEGFSICDPSFAFGCYHSFLGQAIADKGISIVSKLSKKCKERYGESSTGCEHGIGHGIAEYLGPNKLDEALAACSQTNQVNPLFGCTSGLFMEYNSAIIFEKNTVLIQERKPNKKNLHEPCDTLVPEEFRPSCYHEISLWWKNIAKASDEEIGTLCGEAKKKTEQKACYRGWGAVVAEKADYVTEKISEICESGTTVEGSGECKIGALMRLIGASKKDEAKNLCSQNLILKNEAVCIKTF